ncbi:hypothetical protein N802_12500 [Knoellia sinensis KCTC 19936]|uniref:Histidine kinase/HSP90-like ATPase domain-containing protein n=1 Tax=Knoellia sinensis KCTC 19936 TaxID=1385520 RepID=A0A0A0JB76_9MICO|nr:ATP-binding protein [Knoellia sinensis]KGN34403.1 hypothetical protein N802_12500 [Knoellia sinensis KCTC 19936]
MTTVAATTTAATTAATTTAVTTELVNPPDPTTAFPCAVAPDAATASPPAVISPRPDAATAALPAVAASRPDPDPEPSWTLLTQLGSPLDTSSVVTPRRVVLQMLGALALVLAVVAGLGTFAAGRLAEREAVNDAASAADLIAEAVITPLLTDDLLDGVEGSTGTLDAVVRDVVLGDEIVRVKIWAPDGTIVYADEAHLVGRKFTLSQNQRQALADPRTIAEVSDLDQSENEFETGSRLLEVYRPVWTPSGREMLFETYTAYDVVSERAAELRRGFAGVTLSSLLLLVFLMTPVLLRLLRRLGEETQQRERMLERSLEASDSERRRIAGTLHDGPVQELVATSFAASAAAEQATRRGDVELAATLEGMAAASRGNARALRSLLVEIYPQSLTGADPATVLADVAATARGRDVEVELDVDPSIRLTEDDQRLVHRIAQECVRNAATHAAPCNVLVRLGRDETDGAITLLVADDGAGFDPAVVSNPPTGHLGTKVLADLASDAGAELAVQTAPGQGTRWRLRLPTTGGPA